MNILESKHRPFLPILAAAALALPMPAAAQSVPDGAWGVSPPSAPFAKKRQKTTLAAQILLARVGHSPGVIDGFPGGNTARAIEKFQSMNNLSTSGRINSKTMEALTSAAGDAPLLKRYTVTADDASGNLDGAAGSMQAMAENGRVGYDSMAEKLAEKFGMSEGFIRAINPGNGFGEGSEILVANMNRGALSDVARIEIDGGENELRAFDASGDLVASFPATVGSSEFPSPSGSMEVRAVAPEAAYYFDPSEMSWGGDEQLQIPAGPNNPVGGIWIDLSKEGYGIHGSPDPNLIGKTSSHGCVRLTNWDAEWLSEAVSQGTEVVFV